MRYKIVIKSIDGTYNKPLGIIKSLKCGRADRSIYTLELKVPAKDMDLNALKPDLLIEVQRKYYPNDTYKIDGETCYFLRMWYLELDTTGAEILVLKGYDCLYLLEGRINAYYSGHANSVLDMTARAALRAVCYNNFRSGDTDRIIPATYWHNEPEVTTGVTIHKACAWQYVPSLLNEIVDQSRNQGSWITYDIIWDGNFPLEFKTFAEQRGRDRTSSVILSPDKGNLADPRLVFDYSSEVTAAYLLAAGEQSERVVGRADSSRESVDIFSRREGKKENTQISLQTTADAEAQEILNKNRGKVYLTGKIVQTEKMRYGIDWGYGDKVTAKWKGYTFECRVLSYEINYTNEVDSVIAYIVGESWL